MTYITRIANKRILAKYFLYSLQINYLHWKLSASRSIFSCYATYTFGGERLDFFVQMYIEEGLTIVSLRASTAQYFTLSPTVTTQPPVVRLHDAMTILYLTCMAHILVGVKRSSPVLRTGIRV